MVSNDGCNAHCHIESGWSWIGGTITTPDVCTEKCGDGRRFNSNLTYCDDHNLIDGDGCSSAWSIETGWTCSGGTTILQDNCSEIWGDGIRFNSNATYCDDANKSDGDGWSLNWLIETGWSWSEGNSTNKDIWLDIWGDGKKYTSDTKFWDDGNTIDNDGWSSSWYIEVGWKWSGGSSNSKDTWSEIWGDGKRFNSNTTYWDDGNIESGDGWSSTWSIENGWKWSGGSKVTADNWIEIWGDGIRFNSNLTYWDDGNNEELDGWSSLCQVEKKLSMTWRELSK